MSNQRIVSISLLVSDCPYLNGLIQRGRGKHGGVFGVDSHLHDVVVVILVGVNLLPALIPIEQLDRLIIRAT